MQCGICNDDPQKICFDFRKICFDFRFFFFQFSKWAIKSDKNTDSWFKHACWFFFLLQKIEFEFVCFFREKQMLHKHCFVHTIYLVKEKCKLIDTRDETLRRKSSGGITDGLNWLKRHHNFSFFFFHQIFLYIFLHNLLSFFCYVFCI